MTATTRERIIEAAEVLFARNGYAATSLREITYTAKVNIAAVNYHFGSKENLLVEILDRVVVPLNARRLELLSENQEHETTGVAEVLTAFLLPDLEVFHELRSRNPELPRFVSRMYSERGDLMMNVIGRQFAETQQRFYDAFGHGLPELSRDEIAWRLQCVVGIVVYLFAGIHAPGMPPTVGDDIGADLQRMLAVTVPIMSAEPTEVDIGKP